MTGELKGERFVAGKLRSELLARTFLKRVGVPSKHVLIGPALGEDAAVIELGEELVLVVHSDPITGAVENIGWLSVHVAANDLAVTGCKPQWFTIVVLLPENASDEVVEMISKDIDSALKQIGAMLVGGHAEYTWGLSRPITSTTAMGVSKADRIVLTRGARGGDVLIMTKTAALEATSILASEYGTLLEALGMSSKEIERARSMISEISVVPEALALAERGLATSMHDPTEGGIIAGALEMAWASGKTVILHAERVSLDPVTKKAFEIVGLDPLKSLSSGTLLAAIDRELLDEALKTLSSIGVKASVIGEFRVGPPRLEVVSNNGVVEVYESPPTDELIANEERLQKRKEALEGRK
uniref:Hydrogenase assembly protein HupF n=1 Tax=Fervidicoccus fontis TaxID=683846 RepID=A0A7J3ZJU5_9CREN